MRTAGGMDVLAAMDMLGDLTDDAGRTELAALRDRLESARLRVLVAGEAKRGKSTLVNALLGREVMPSGAVPLTAVPATVVQAQAGAEGVEVTFSNGRAERFPLLALGDFVTERGNPGNRRGVAAVTVRLDAPVLARGVEIVDTPGTGSVHAHNTAAADMALPSMDAAIFVLTADPPVSATERELLRRVAGLSVALFVVLNKADYLDEPALAETLEFTAGVVAEATGRPERVYPLSARDALRADGDPGFGEFASAFAGYAGTGRMAGLEQSVTRHTRRIAQRLLDETMLARRAAELPGAEAAAQIAEFRARLDAVTGRQAAAEDRAAGQSRRLLEALNAAANRARPELAAAVGTKIAEFLDGELATAAPAEIERGGRARLASLVADAAEAWRQEQAAALEHGLGDIDRQLTGELEAELAAVRSAAAQVLGLDLAVPSPGGLLEPDLGFFYTLAEHIDQSELLAGAVRRRLPGRYGRRLARQWLLGQVRELTDSQVGRARGDLQYQLAEATRRLLADLRRRYADSIERLAAALDRAAAIRAGAAGQAGRQLAALAERERRLRLAVSRLPADETQQAAASTGPP